MIIDHSIVEHSLKHYIYLHQFPELSFQETATSAYIKKQLELLNIPHISVGPTGLIGWLKCKNSSRTIALRADIDALPISEDKSHTLISQKENVMHACGHDMHTACLLGAAEYLQKHQEALPANIMLIFQHGEETLPGGANDIIHSDFFLQHRPEWIIAQHTEPDLPVGTMGICSGPYMASGDEIYIHLHGPGGHAALPERTTDLIVIASHIVLALQQITSRNASPFTPTVLTFGNIRCQSAMNIIPQELTLEGTFRTFDESWRAQGKEKIRRIALAIAESMGAHAEVNLIEGYPSLYNDPERAQATLKILKEQWGEQAVVELPKRMTTEDFARYSLLLPATFIRLGIKGEQLCGKLHTSTFCADTTALKYGIQNFCSLVFSYS